MKRADGAALAYVAALLSLWVLALPCSMLRLLAASLVVVE